jgi:hypothetical protein
LKFQHATCLRTRYKGFQSSSYGTPKPCSLHIMSLYDEGLANTLPSDWFVIDRSRATSYTGLQITCALSLGLHNLDSHLGVPIMRHGSNTLSDSCVGHWKHLVEKRARVGAVLRGETDLPPATGHRLPSSAATRQVRSVSSGRVQKASSSATHRRSLSLASAELDPILSATSGSQQSSAFDSAHVSQSPERWKPRHIRIIPRTTPMNAWLPTWSEDTITQGIQDLKQAPNNHVCMFEI